MTRDRLVRIIRAAWQIAALAPDQRRQRQLVKPDQAMRRAPWREDERPHGAGAGAALVASIWASASATASKVSSVEAWRGLYLRTGSSAAKSAHLPDGGGPLSFSMRCIVARNSISSGGVAPVTWRALSDGEA